MVSGDIVSEISLAKEIGTSRTPVREAIRQLSQEGIVEQVPRYGTVVRTISLEDIIEVCELREALEPYAAAKCVKMISGSELVLLGELCDEIKTIRDNLVSSGEEFIKIDNQQRFLALDLGFHFTIIRSAGNKRIKQALIGARVLSKLFGAMRGIKVASVESSYFYHAGILDAIKAKDAVKASELMHAHLQESARPSRQQYDLLKQAEQISEVKRDSEDKILKLEDVIEECGFSNAAMALM
jgi:DNA-binding GntR family transcriptional regulator